MVKPFVKINEFYSSFEGYAALVIESDSTHMLVSNNKNGFVPRFSPGFIYMYSTYMEF